MVDQVLIETMSPSIANLTVEGVGDNTPGAKKTYFMEGIFIQGDKKNHNGRIYPRREIENAVRSVNERIQKDLTILGEVDHPSNLQINLDRVSHMITHMRLDGSDGIGKLKIIEEMPMGRICKTLLEFGAKLGVSSRGTGEVDYNGHVKNFEIVTVDIVAQPSAPDAYPRAMMEAIEHYKKSNMIIDLATSVEYDTGAEKYLKKAIIEFIDELKF